MPPSQGEEKVPDKKGSRRDDDTAWRAKVGKDTQELVDVLRREVRKHSPEAVFYAPEKQEIIAGNRLVTLCREGKIPGVPADRQRDRLMFLLHLAPASQMWRGKLYTLATVDRNLSMMLEQTRRDWETLKDHPDEWGGVRA